MFYDAPGERVHIELVTYENGQELTSMDEYFFHKQVSWWKVFNITQE